LVDILAERGVVQTAETAGLQRRVIVTLAQRLRPKERLDFDQALTELERAVEIALDVITKGASGASEDEFVNAVLAQVAERTKNEDLDGAAQALDDALAEVNREEAEQREATRRKKVLFLQAAVQQHTLRRDALAVVNRIELLVAIDETSDRPAWLPGFREQYDNYLADGETKGVNFSLLIAVECARRAVATVRDKGEHGTAAILLGNALSRLGERESGTERLLEAVEAYRDALKEWTRERVPLDWAMTQNNLGNALSTLGQRESGTERLLEAVEAYRDALKEWTRERVPLQWAMTQTNLGNAQALLNERLRLLHNS